MTTTIPQRENPALDKQRVIDALKQCREDLKGITDERRYLYNTGRNGIVDYMLVQIIFGDLDYDNEKPFDAEKELEQAKEGMRKFNERWGGVKFNREQSSETDSPLPPSTIPKRGESN